MKVIFKIIIYTIVIVIASDLVMAKLFLPPDVNFREPSEYYHHGLRPNSVSYGIWGNSTYVIYTNSLGLRDKNNREVNMNSSTYRIMFIGDSFTESVGYPYNMTFVGIIDDKYSDEEVEILNAGVLSYSPKLYYLKTKYLIERGLKFDELIVMVDISDVQDEIVYRYFEPNMNSSYSYLFAAKTFLYQNSLIFRGFYSTFRDPIKGSVGNTSAYWRDDQYNAVRGTWTVDKQELEKWGNAGLAFAEENMEKLYRICAGNKIKMTVVVYPWPTQIQENDSDSIQVSFWRNFSEERNITFINLFPYFFNPRLTTNQTIERYFIKGDVHWNEEGHAYVAELLEEDYFDKKFK